MEICIKNVEIGKGKPKIVIPIMGKTYQDLEAELIFLKDQVFDIIEWRVDFLENLEIKNIKNILCKIEDVFGHIPLIFTIRSFEEGGNKEIGEEQYLKIIDNVLDFGKIDIIDFELSKMEKLKRAIEKARKSNIKIIASTHNFKFTPPKSTILEIFEKGSKFGADIQKVAFMPINFNDVISVMDATYNSVMEKSLIVVGISMGQLGIISRISGEYSKSALTFAKGKYESAPGQLDAKLVKQIIDDI